jgi:hypothetical protein
MHLLAYLQTTAGLYSDAEATLRETYLTMRKFGWNEESDG